MDTDNGNKGSGDEGGTTTHDDSANPIEAGDSSDEEGQRPAYQADGPSAEHAALDLDLPPEVDQQPHPDSRGLQVVDQNHAMSSFQRNQRFQGQR